MEHFYVDDCLKTLATELEAMELISNITEVCHRGGFHLSKWISNSRAVLGAVPQEDRAKEIKDLDLSKDQLPMERALGLQWCVQRDFQTKWIGSLSQLTDFEVPRCFKPNDFGESVHNQIHHFSDASELGYEEGWPKESIDNVELCEDDPEVRKSATVNAIMQTCEERPTDKLLNHFSDWLKLRVAVAWILKVKEALKHCVQKRNDTKKGCKMTQRVTRMTKGCVTDNIKEAITVDDLIMAEKAILSYVQRQSFTEEINMLQEGAANVKKGSKIYRLDPVLDNGILRVGGRLRRTAMPEERKHPAILAKDHHVSTLILRHVHIQTGHGGRNHMLSEEAQR
ncbi:hypothetical protein N1851_024657 [Merluccius polli]|uniref:Uncharacterized protein n=1 Tax=Merluccius polli TaxID=89951 RepID=A0AA47MEL6_MERPO|nr:hypothetical protein N1851_024657 [Merluccius polli]